MIVVSLDIGIRNLSVCVLSNTRLENKEVQEQEQELKQQSLWRILPLITEEVKVKQVSLDQISQFLYECLDDLMTMVHDIDKTSDLIVLLENQPCMKAPLMKTIQIMIYSYFQMQKHVGIINPSIHLVSAAQKTKGHAFQLPETTFSGYKKRKWESVNYCTKYLETYANFSDQLVYFNSHKKKDDLADAFLQALVWLKTYKSPKNKNPDEVLKFIQDFKFV